MATKKTTPALEVPENEDKELDQAAEKLEQLTEKAGKNELAEKDAEIEKLKKELARKRSSEKQTDYDRVKQACEEAAAAGVDPWTVEIEIMIPHREKSEDPWYWIQVNGRSVQVPANDRYQALKLPFADVLVEMLKSEKQSLDYQDSLEVFDPVVNPHKK